MFVVYLLLIFEGVLRKWLFPQYSQILFFVRDPFVLLSYAMALSTGWWPRGRTALTIGLIFGAFGAALGIIQTFTGPEAGDKQLLLAAYGWRSYFFYIPLAFIIGETFDAKDLRRIVQLTLLLAIPVGVLVTAQFYAGSESPLNIGSATDASLQFRGLALDGEHTRGSGPFTSDLGEKQFIVSCVAMLLYAWIVAAPQRPLPLFWLGFVTIAAFSAIAHGGSRGSLVHSGIVLIVVVSTGAVMKLRSIGRRAILFPIALIGGGLTLVPLLFSSGYSAFVGRWNTAAQIESQAFSGGIFGRALFSFIDFARLFGDTPILGYGLGMGGNASTTLGATINGMIPLSLAESDWARHMVDLGPALAVCYIVYRVSLTSFLGWKSFNATRVSSDPLPGALFGFVGIDLLYGLIAGHGTVNGYCWIFTGLCFAASRASVAIPACQAEVASSAATRRFPNLLR